MKDETGFFKNKRAITERMIAYGFNQVGDTYVYSTPILANNFVLQVEISHNNVYANIYDIGSECEYILHNILGSEGKFVGAIRTEYKRILNDIRDKCFERDIFKSLEFKAISEYVDNKYGDKPEFLWDKPPDAAILRRKDSKKWYAIFMKIAAAKLGLHQSDEIEIMNFKAKTDGETHIIDNLTFFPGWHMNKKHWVTVILNGTVPVSKIIFLVNISYKLAQK